MSIVYRPIKKILVANRGEIAVRIMQTAQRMGIGTVAVYSDADFNEWFVCQADEAYCLGGNQASENYLNADKIIKAAQETKADAIHPGYGFLSENQDFAKKCTEAGIIFIGPSPEAIYAMGDKKRAKEIVEKHQVPTIPGYHGTAQSIEILTQEALKIGFPLLLKASAGGGGKGMRIVNFEKDLKQEIEAAQRESKSAFGDDTLLIEKYFPSARHIEFQIFGDQHGNIVQLFERDCSIQRRHQKIIEESPAAALDPEIRKSMATAAVNAAKSIQYYSAGTVEFIYIEPSENQAAAFYFLEVNTRLQVEHPVTEMITGIDLVQWQIEVAEGKKLPLKQDEIRAEGHAIEVRLYAENPYNNFLPSTGDVLCFKPYTLSNARFDSGIISGSKIDIFYDPMLAKIITHGSTRSEALRKMNHTLQQTVYAGTNTNLHFLQQVLNHPDFNSGKWDTSFLKTHPELLVRPIPNQDQLFHALVASALLGWLQRKEQRKILNAMVGGWRNLPYKNQSISFLFDSQQYDLNYKESADGSFKFFIHDQIFDVVLSDVALPQLVLMINRYRSTFHVFRKNENYFVHHPLTDTLNIKAVDKFPLAEAEKMKGAYRAPMPGEIIKVFVKEGDEVESGMPLVVMLSMKMENTIEAFESGKVTDLYVAEKKFVEADALLLKIE